MGQIETDSPIIIITYAILAGILPALVWLWFWLHEDRLHPEPRKRLFISFIGGMIMVPIVYPLQKVSFEYFGGNTIGITLMTIFAWATIEELAKYISAGITALRSRDYDEPIDAPIYLITTALGFAALENALFILTPLITNGDLFAGFSIGNSRFMGASVLHVVCSGILGYAIAREFYRSHLAKLGWRILGLCLAITLHTAFNLFIINSENGTETFFVFSSLWAFALIMLFLFEKVKKIQK